VLAWVKLEDVGAIFSGDQPLGEAAPDVAQFGGTQPAFEKRFLAADTVALQKAAYVIQSSGAGNVVANQVEGTGDILHALILGSQLSPLLRGKLVGGASLLKI
jgi:hypothetical protein